MKTRQEHIIAPSMSWIRRHRILALLAPFCGTVVLIFLWFGIGLFFIDRVETQKPFHDLLECVCFFLVLASVGMTKVFDIGPGNLIVYRWLSWPFFLVPAILFLTLKRASWTIAAYTLYCILVFICIYAGYIWAVAQTIWVQ